ncbi:MAG: glycosyltransferase family protein [Acidimicrobiales bacterium]
MSPHPLIVVQARAGSTRLPGKVLADLGGQPMLGFQLHRLLPITDRLRATIVVATSDLPGDDAVAAVAEHVGVGVVRGSEADVLGRYAIALAQHPADTVVRLTGDCPLTDPFIVEAAISLHLETGADYTSNVLPRSYPKGLDVEVLSARALRHAELEATEAADREHVTPYLYRRPERFRLANLHSGQNLGEEWWTVDTPADLDRLREIVALVPDPLVASWNRILSVVGRANKPKPGQVVLRPREGPEPGSAPWTRTWAVEVDGAEVGAASISVGKGKVDRRVQVPEPWVEPTREAMYRLLLGDQQSRP